MFPERCVYFVASSPVLEPTSVACAETNSSTLEALSVDKFLAPFWSPQLWHVQGKRSKVSIAMFPERCQGLTQVEIMILCSACLRPRFGAHMLGP